MTTQAYYVKIPGAVPDELHRIFVHLPEGGSFLIRRVFGSVDVKENKAVEPRPEWQPVPMEAHHAQPYIDLCREHVSRQEMRACVRTIQSDRYEDAAKAALTYPYVVAVGRYDIPRVWRMETTKRGQTRWRIYDRKNDKWGKTLRGEPARILAVMDDSAFECWRQTKCTYQQVAIPLGQLAEVRE